MGREKTEEIIEWETIAGFLGLTEEQVSRMSVEEIDALIEQKTGEKPKIVQLNEVSLLKEELGKQVNDIIWE